jgi:hypothetical protein
MRRVKGDPLVSAVRKTRAEFKKTPLGRLQSLFSERIKWKRRATIARNKLEQNQAEIDSLAEALASEAQGVVK